MPDVKVTWDVDAIEAILIAHTKRLFNAMTHSFGEAEVKWDAGGHKGTAQVTIECTEKESK